MFRFLSIMIVALVVGAGPAAAQCKTKLKDSDSFRELSSILACLNKEIRSLKSKIAGLKKGRKAFVPGLNPKKFKTVATGKMGIFHLALNKCVRSGSTLSCQLIVTGKGEDGKFYIRKGSRLYDDRGRPFSISNVTYNSKKGDFYNFSEFIADIPVATSIEFDGISSETKSISSLRLVVSTDGPGGTIHLRHIPIEVK